MLPVLGLLEVGSKIIDKIWPDKDEAEKAKVRLMELQQAGEFKEMETDLARDLAQIEVNKIEAASESKYKSWWRPTYGWIGAIGMGYNYIGCPTVSYFTNIINSVVLYNIDRPGAWIPIVAPQPLNFEVMMPVVLTLLGGSYLRTREKGLGVN